MKDNDEKLINEAYDSKQSQWTPPADLDQFLEWVAKYHPKWKGKDELETLKRILVTSDGLGRTVQEAAFITLVRLLNK